MVGLNKFCTINVEEFNFLNITLYFSYINEI